MKIALITDTHFGGRNDSPAFNEFFFKFWEGVFFPYIENHNIDHIIHLGDVVDRRKFINFQTLHSLRTRFIERIPHNTYVDVIVGNHDVPYRNTNEVNAIRELFSNHSHLNVISECQTLQRGGIDIAFIPWINASNYESTKSFIANTPATVAMGHLEIAGFEMDRGNICTTGMARENFSKFETVYTGHFHHRSSDGHISYLGNTYEMTWADYGDKRGFHIFDTKTLDIEFIENPYKMFHKVVYDDSIETLESVMEKDFSPYNGVIVKTIVACKNNPVLFDRFMDGLYKSQPLDITIVEDFTDYNELIEGDIINQADSTTDILDKFVDSTELGLDKIKMKNILHEIYNEAISQENR